MLRSDGQRRLVKCSHVAAASLFAILAGIAPAPAPAAPGIPVTGWTATSTTSMSITGDLSISPGRIAFAGKTFPLRDPQVLRGARLANALKIPSLVAPAGASATLYETSIPATVTLRGGNTLCGSNATARWMLFVRSPASPGHKAELHVGVFSNATAPNLDPKAIANSRSFCGTYFYESP